MKPSRRYACLQSDTSGVTSLWCSDTDGMPSLYQQPMVNGMESAWAQSWCNHIVCNISFSLRLWLTVFFFLNARLDDIQVAAPFEPQPWTQTSPPPSVLCPGPWHATRHFIRHTLTWVTPALDAHQSLNCILFLLSLAYCLNLLWVCKWCHIAQGPF